MKFFVKNLVIAGVLATGAVSMTVAQTDNTPFEQWYRAKYGRLSPPEQARIDAELASTAYREVPSAQVRAAGNSWNDGWYRTKFGRPSPLEQTR